MLFHAHLPGTYLYVILIITHVVLFWNVLR